jgi:hypothetical protein
MDGKSYEYLIGIATQELVDKFHEEFPKKKEELPEWVREIRIEIFTRHSMMSEQPIVNGTYLEDLDISEEDLTLLYSFFDFVRDYFDSITFLSLNYESDDEMIFNIEKGEYTLYGNYS